MISGGSAGLSTMIALPRRAPPTVSIARAVVSVNSSMLALVPGPADRDEIDATISAYATGATDGDRRHDRDGGLAAAGHHVDLAGVAVRVEVDRRHHERPERGRGQVDDADVVRRQRLGVGLVRRRRRRVEHHPDLAEAGQGQQPSTPSAVVATPSRAARASPSEAGSMPAIARIRSGPPAAQQLDHQVRADVAGPDDRRSDHRGALASGEPGAVTLTQPADLGREPVTRPRPATIGPSAPDSTISPARSGWPYDRAAAASQATATAGWPRQAAPDPVDTSSSPRRSRIGHAARSRPPGGRRSGPTANSPDEALSATVSTMEMSHPAMRLSTISSAAATAPVAASTSSGPMSARPDRVRA